MSYHANSEERVGLIAGLRGLADFLDQNPDLPAPRRADVIVFTADGTDAEMFAERKRGRNGRGSRMRP